MVKWLDKALDELVTTIIESDSYKTCVALKEKMSHNEEICLLIEELKDTQRRYVKSNYDSDIKKELDTLEEELYDIPIYVTYIKYLEEVNMMLSYIEDDLNDYFFKLVNEKDYE